MTAKRVSVLLLGAALVVSATLPFTSWYIASAGVVDDTDQALLVSDLKTQGARITYHRQTQKVNFISVTPQSPIIVSGTSVAAAPANNAMAALQTYGALFGLQDPASELRVKKQRTSAAGRRSMVRYQQVHKGIPVIGGELNVNMDRNGGLLSMNGEISPQLSLGVRPVFAAKDARHKALAAVAKWHQVSVNQLSTSARELSVYDPRLLSPSDFPASLVWRLEVSATDRTLPIREFVLVDAALGHIVLHFNQVHRAKNRNTYDAGGTANLPGTLVCNEASGDACSSGANATGLEIDTSSTGMVKIAIKSYSHGKLMKNRQRETEKRVIKQLLTLKDRVNNALQPEAKGGGGV